MTMVKVLYGESQYILPESVHANDVHHARCEQASNTVRRLNVEDLDETAATLQTQPTSLEDRLAARVRVEVINVQ
jgi:hypothetical protein